MTTIKITQLTDIGANLASTTVLPVVNMAGTPTTEKTVLGNIANVVLAGAGGNYVAAAKATTATTANTVLTAAQPNITSTGNLTGLTVSNATGVVNFSNTANVTLGEVANLHISGGTNGQVLTTNGSNVLSWTTVSSGNSSYGNSNVAAYLPTYTGNIGVDTLVFADNTFQATAFVGTATTAEGLSNIGNATVVVDPLGVNNVWTFGTDGNLNTPGDIVGPANANLTIYANAGVHEFIFGDDGTFYAPDNVVLGGNSIYIGPGANTLNGIEHEVFIASSNLFPYVQAVVNNISDNGSADWVALGARGGDTGGQASLGFTSSGFGDANYTITGNGDGYVLVQSYAPGQTLLGGGGNLVLATGNQGSVKDIIFGTGGFLTANTFGRISHSNNSLELTRTGASLKFPDGSTQTTAYTGGGNTGNVTFDDVTIQGVNGLNLSAGSDFTANLAYLQVRAGDVASHIHLDTGNNEAYDQYFGNDSKFVKLGLGIAGNVSIGTYQDGGVGQFEWTFDSNGNLILAGGNSVIQSIANSSLDPLTPNASTMVLTPDQSYSSQSLVLDPTSPGHIHLRAPSFAGDIDIPAANIFLGGEDTSFEVTVGANNYAMIHSGGNTWTFGIDGNLIVPGNILSTQSSNLTIGSSYSVKIVGDNGDNNLTWTFDGSSGELLFPNGPLIDPTDSIFEVRGAEAINFEANATVNIYTDTSNNGWQWQFGDDGNTGFPGNLNYNGIASPSPSINGFSSASFNMNLTADQVYMSDNAISTVGGSSNLILNTQYGTATDAFIQVPTFQDGGEELIIKNGYGSSLGIRVQTTTGNFTFIGNNFSVPGDITANNIGNIASTNYDGNASNVLYGNGSFAAAPSGGSYGDSNVVSLLSSFGSNTITTTGNVSVGNIAGSTNGYTIGYLNIPQVAASNTTLALGDAGKHYYSTTAGNFTLTVPNNTSAAFATGTAISIVVQAAGNILVNASSGVTLYMAGNSTAANRVVGGYGMATLMKVATNTWFINGTGVS